MIKFVGVVWRKPGMSREDFLHHWQTNHAEVVKKLPGLRKYVQGPAVTRAGREPVIDGSPSCGSTTSRPSGAPGDHRPARPCAKTKGASSTSNAATPSGPRIITSARNSCRL